MAIFQNGFDAYQVFYYSGALQFQAVVQVYNVGVFNGRIGFYPDAGPIVPNGVITPAGVPIPAINYPLSSFHNVMSMLRFEKPLYIFLDTGTGTGFVGTLQLEPVGEQEGK
jgi:hypothetical protein